MKARFITEIGTRISLRRYWGDDCPHPSGRRLHDVRIRVKDILGEFPTPELADHYAGWAWPEACGCGARPPSDAPRQVFRERLYDSPEGTPQPGDLYWIPCPAVTGGVAWMCPWTNCEGRHLYAVLPNGHEWDLDSRASNCTRLTDTTHRCWVRHGVPSDIHVDKAGDTCAAGTGSILSGTYHGFLHNGHFTP